MQQQIKPVPYGRKLNRLYSNKFYLSAERYRELISMLEHGMIRDDREAVAFVDEHGEWLDG